MTTAATLTRFLSIKRREIIGKSPTTQRIIRESMERVKKYFEEKKKKNKQLELF